MRTTKMSCFGCGAPMGRIGALRVTIAVQEGERGMVNRQALVLCWRCAKQRDLVLRLGEVPARRLFMQRNLAASHPATAEPPTREPALLTPRAS